MNDEIIQLILDKLYEAVTDNDIKKVEEAIKIINDELDNPIKDYQEDIEWH